MPSTSLETPTPQTTTTGPAAMAASWCDRLRNRLRKAAPVLAAAAFVGMGTTAAEAQMQAAPVYASPDAGAPAIWPQQAPPGAQPWPGISPYESSNILSTQHVNQDGVWMKNIYQKDRQYNFSIDAVMFKFNKAGDKVIGANPLDGALSPTGQIFSAGIANPNDPSPPIDDDSGFRDGSALESLFDQFPAGFTLAGPGVFPYALTAGDEDEPVDDGDLELVASNLAYPIRTLDDLGDYSNIGTRLRWGFDNGDGSGLRLHAFWSGEANTDFTRGLDNLNGIPLNILNFGVNGGSFLNIQNGAIPLENNLPTFPVLGDTVQITGSTQKYDIFYQLTNSTEVFGSGANIFSTALIDRNAIRVRSFWGVDYTSIDETFGFRGIDSGASSDLEDYESDAGILPGGGGAGGGGGGGGTNDILSSRPESSDIASPEIGGLNIPNVFFEASLSSKTRTHLFGPTFGLQYDIGKGKYFQLHGETVVGLMANYEQTKIQSRNIGEQEHSKTVYGIDFLTDPVTGLARPDDFAQSQSEAKHTHVSPMLKQNVSADLKLSTLFKSLGKTELFEEAYFTAGYTITVIGSVQRPGEAIFWRGFTGDVETSFPYAISDRSTFVFQEANFGLEWLY